MPVNEKNIGARSSLQRPMKVSYAAGSDHVWRSGVAAMEVSPDLLERRSLNQPDNFGQRSQGAALGFCAALPCPEVTLDGGVDSDTSRTFHKPFALRRHSVIGLWNDIPYETGNAKFRSQ